MGERVGIIPKLHLGGGKSDMFPALEHAVQNTPHQNNNFQFFS